jgi:hypothetical protein
MLADQVEALGVVEQRGQADQVGAHGTFTSAGGSSPDQPVTTAFVTFETATRSAADNPISSSPQNPI